jgi:quercetin dioxygenase-like cupin family protein
MRNYRKTLWRSCLMASVVLVAGVAHAGSASPSGKVMTVQFDKRQVVKIESGDFHFKPGQRAPVHTHPAPAIGYVTKGTIIQKVEGRAPILLQTGDIFYEPAGPNITMFDNASATKEAIFIDVNLQQKGEPFIVFPKPPTEAIDRRALPQTTYAKGVDVDGVDVYNHVIQPDAKQYLDIASPISGYIAEGAVTLYVDGKRKQTVKAGSNFYLYQDGKGAVLSNASSERPARVIVFNLHKQ